MSNEKGGMTRDLIKVRLELITPIHIGSGANYRDYYIEDGRVFRIDLDGIVKDPEFPKYKEEVIKSALRRSVGFELMNIAPALVKRHILYSLDVTRGDLRRNIREHIKTGGRPYIPGSSLKGALLTPLLWKYIREGRVKVDQRVLYLREKESQEFERILDALFDEICEDPLWRRRTDSEDEGGKNWSRERDRERYEHKSRFRRWIGISDPEPVDMKYLTVAEIDVYPNGPKILAEILRAGTVFEFTIVSQPGLRLDLKDIIRTSDEFYHAVLSKENEWRRLRGLEELKFKGTMLLRIGWGSSQLATSVRSAILNLDHNAKPKTRKLVMPSKLPLGWALLSLK